MSSIKKIILFTENLGPGGAERQLVGLAVALKNQNYEVTVMTYIKNQFYEPYLHENGIRYIFCNAGTNKVMRIFQVAKNIIKLRPNTVISFLTAPNKLICLLKPLGFKLVVSERNATLHWGLSEKIRFYFYRMADVVVANSEFEMENIKTHQPAIAGKTIAITNFVDTDTFTPAPHEENVVPVVLSVGRITKQKNVLRFIDSVKLLKDRGYTFVIKWFGNHAYKDYCAEVYKKIEQQGLTNVFLIQESSRTILKEYQCADIFCLPSLHEGYPNVLCEAMSCGLPVACSNVCENPRIAKNGINGFLFNPYSVEEIADAIAKLIDMKKEEKLAMGGTNRKQMIDNNSIEIFCQKYIRIL